MAEVSIDVVVPVHGKYELTRQCLRSLELQTTSPTVYLVDDASPDDTLRRVRDDFPRVRVVPLPTNQGFARACNAGISAGNGEIVVLVNNDVVVESTLVADMLRAFAEPHVGSAAPVILRPDGRIDAFGITCDPTMSGFLRLHGEPLERLADAKCYALLGPYGAIAGYRRRAIDEVGPLDDGIFMYGEELDLAVRLGQAGWAPKGVERVGGVHLGSGTAQRGSLRQVRMAGFGRGYLLHKYRKVIGIHMVRAIAIEVVVCVAALVRDRSFAAVSGRIAGYRACRSVSQVRTDPGFDRSIGVLESLALRASRWSRRS